MVDFDSPREPRFPLVFNSMAAMPVLMWQNNLLARAARNLLISL